MILNKFKKLFQGHTLAHFIYSKTLRKLGFKYRKEIKVKKWVKKNLQFIRKNNLYPFYFNANNGFCEINGLKFLYATEYEAGMMGLEFDGVYEPIETKLILANLKEDHIFFDIGANFGYYSLVVAKNIKNVSIHSFEPIKGVIGNFKKNIDINGLSHIIKANCLAISDKETKVRMTSYLYGDDHIVKNYGIINKGLVSVNATTIDKYVKENKIPKIDFIKCDIEGAELLMLKGAIESLKKFKPKLLLEIEKECTKRYSYDPVEIFNFLEKLNYKYQIIGTDKKIHLPSGNIENDLLIGHNFYFLVNKNL